MIIYKIDIPATPGMVYIGQTTRLLGHRWRQHKAPSSTTLIGKEDLNGKLYGVWFLSPQEYDKLVETICSDFNSRQLASIE